MVEIGYALSSEEHAPNDLVRQARLAEEAGFTFALISDHYHPWVDAQGHSPFVWSVIGGIAQATQRLRLATGVTCPIMRIHPAIIAQAAATAAAMMPGRFSLGVGTGERLNEHILGGAWPAHTVRLEMLEEAVDVMRLLWRGGVRSFSGLYYTVENARLYTLPEQPPQVFVAASGPKAATLAGHIGDGLIATSADAQLVQTFQAAGGAGKPRIGQCTVCWAPDEATAKRTAFEIWPNGGLKDPLNTELALPSHFQRAAAMVTEDDVAESIVCGPDPEKHRAKIQEFVDAGFDQVYVHQVGHDQEGFMRFYQREILPKFQSSPQPARGAAA
ncbi:MAG TPA: TIGR03557 family F420-dependent LLM class oxidoreductase [Chloroflexota bacterium]|jgi:coenzyme F420-dependent glucose-6-phosphate dehydrogenase|nr:TIGR03557 family F420-dependent LLM class oxidoreductase [Chloroflexota bacterium]